MARRCLAHLKVQIEIEKNHKILTTDLYLLFKLLWCEIYLTSSKFEAHYKSNYLGIVHSVQPEVVSFLVSGAD